MTKVKGETGCLNASLSFLHLSEKSLIDAKFVGCSFYLNTLQYVIEVEECFLGATIFLWNILAP